MVIYQVGIGSDDGLIPSGTNPLPELMLTSLQKDGVAFMGEHFCSKCLRYPIEIRFENYTFKKISRSPIDQSVTKWQWQSGSHEYIQGTASLILTLPYVYRTPLHITPHWLTIRLWHFTPSHHCPSLPHTSVQKLSMAPPGWSWLCWRFCSEIISIGNSCVVVAH